MIYDIVFSIYNGFENRSSVVDKLLNNNFYDCIIKNGSDYRPQYIKFNNKDINLKIIPTGIVHNKPSLIGLNGCIKINQLNKEILILKKLNIDIYRFLFIEENACIEYNNKTVKIDTIDLYKISNIFTFSPNIIKKSKFLEKYSRPLIESSNGYYTIEGNDYNFEKSNKLLKTTSVYSEFAPIYIGNIIGIASIFECYKNYKKENIIDIYNLHNSLSDNNKLTYFFDDVLLSFNWINLDKLKNSIIESGCNIIYIVDMDLISKLDKYNVYYDSKLINLENIENLKNYINKKLTEIDNISNIIFIKN